MDPGSPGSTSRHGGTSENRESGASWDSCTVFGALLHHELYVSCDKRNLHKPAHLHGVLCQVGRHLDAVEMDATAGPVGHCSGMQQLDSEAVGGAHLQRVHGGVEVVLCKAPHDMEA